MGEKYKRIISYLIFGVLTTVINVAAYAVCFRVLGVPNVYSTVAAWFIAVLFAFFTNKVFVFGSREWKGAAVVSEALRFFGSRALTGVLEVAAMYLFVDVLAQPGTLMKLLTNVGVILLNYIAGRFFVFDR